MNNLSNYIILFIFTFVANAVLTKLLIKILPYFGIVDVPAERRVHNKVTPRGGGLSIALIAIIAFCGFEYFCLDNLYYSIRFLPILSFIAIISFWDDLGHIPALIRLIIHLICASLTVYFFLNPYFIFKDELPLYFNFILSIVSLSAFLNIYNFMDGIDGITCAQSIHLSITILLLCYFKSDIIINVNFVIILNIIILAVSISFIWFNWQPASIFLGDIGSICLGFVMGLSLLLVANSSLHLLLACFIASLYYLGDGGVTILIRLYNKEKIWQPHLKHFFHKAVQRGKSHKQVVVNIIICNILLMILAISSLYFSLISLLLALSLVVFILIRL